MNYIWKATIVEEGQKKFNSFTFVKGF